MNQRQLRYFVEVYNQRSLKKVADYFMITPQGVSKMIKTMEDEIGQKLFLREKNTIVPTDTAIDLYPHAEKIVDEFDLIENHSKSKRRKITIYGIDSVMDFYLMDFLVEFYRKNPNISIKYMETSNDKAVENLRKNECDFALLQETFENEEIVNKKLFITPFVLLANKKNPISKYDTVDEKAIGQVKLAGRGYEYALYRRTMKRINNLGINETTVMETNNERLLINLVEHDLAVATVNEAVAKHYQTPNMKIIHFNNENTYDHISISYHKHLNAEAKMFLSEIEKWIKTK